MNYIFPYPRLSHGGFAPMGQALGIDVNLAFSDTPEGVTRVGNSLGDESSKYYTPISLVIMTDQPDTVRFLLESGAKPRGRTRSGNSPLVYALERKWQKQVDLLLKHNAPLESIGLYSGGTPLMNIARRGNLAQAKRLITAGAKVGFVSPFHVSNNSSGKYWRSSDAVTAFLLSCYSGKNDMAAYLLDQGANLKKLDGNGRSALHAAIMGGKQETCAWLLEKGLNANEPLAKNGERPLDTAARVAPLEIIELLLKNGAKKTESAHAKAVEAKRRNSILDSLKLQ